MGGVEDACAHRFGTLPISVLLRRSWSDSRCLHGRFFIWGRRKVALTAEGALAYSPASCSPAAAEPDARRINWTTWEGLHGGRQLPACGPRSGRTLAWRPAPASISRAGQVVRLATSCPLPPRRNGVLCPPGTRFFRGFFYADCWANADHFVPSLKLSLLPANILFASMRVTAKNQNVWDRTAGGTRHF